MALFTKPEGIRYVDMAIWIDQNAYLNNCNEDKLYEYIYHIINMLASKYKYFEDKELHEDFCIYAATYVFNRIKNPKQFEIEENGQPKQNKIKSILNYLKGSIYGLKVNFEQSAFYNLSPKPDIIESQNVIDREYWVTNYISTHNYNACEFSICLQDLVKCIWETCKRTPYSNDYIMLSNIYLSTLLTFLNQITPQKELIFKNKSITDSDIRRLYKITDPLKTVILYNLDNEFKTYILYLVNSSKKTLARDLSSIVDSWQPSDTVISCLISNQIEYFLGSNNEDKQ